MKAPFSSFILLSASVLVLSGCASEALIDAIANRDFNKEVSLINKGIRLDCTMCVAAEWGDNRLVDYLVKKGESINSRREYNGRTPLMSAIEGMQWPTAEILMNNGADVNLVDKNGDTALTLTLSELKKYIQIDRDFIQKSSAHGNYWQPVIVKILIKHGAKVNIINHNGDSSLTLAIDNEMSETVQFLISKGADKAYVAARQNAEMERKRQDKADSRAFWKGAATLATGVAVGKATSGYSPDQQTRMMKSSMKAVDSGDTSELTETTNQVKAEQAQSHKAKMQAIEEQKERERAAAQRAQEEERNNQAQRRHQQSQAQPRNAPSLSAGSRGGLAETSQQDQERQRKELQAQLNAKQQSRNRNEEQLQQQAQQNNREQGQRNRQSGNTNIAGLSGNNGSAAPSTVAGKKVVHGPEQLEAVAVCWQSKQRKENWRCDGPGQLTILGDSLENALGYSGCRPYRTTDGDRTITLRGGESVSATVYVCGWGIWTEYDIAKKYGIVVQRNKYQCDNGPKSHCKENFQLTD